ncbi:MAG: helix-turn-helix transcriptional regulator [Acidobacteriota bacterium]|nr:helix-turn-helix transcriptional regulator [Acidobacteriota bacterium]
MHPRQQTLRSTLGRALRHIRLEGRLSLDDVERATRGEGVRVTRSHLSRVETGQADITLSRYLSLLRALGEGVGETTARLAALLDEDLLEGAGGRVRWRQALAAGDLLGATRVLRALHARSQPALDRPSLRSWGRAEAALGRWNAACHVLRLALPSAPSRGDVLALATAQIGGGQAAVAGLLVAGLRPDPLTRLVGAISHLATAHSSRPSSWPKRSAPRTMRRLTTMWRPWPRRCVPRSIVARDVAARHGPSADARCRWARRKLRSASSPCARPPAARHLPDDAVRG